MDYDTFRSKFPSSKTLERCGLTKDVFVRQYTDTFNKRGPLAVGLSDVGIGKLVESGAIVEKGGKLVFLPEKADMESLFRQSVGESFQAFLDVFVSLVHPMQDGKRPLASIILSRDVSIRIAEEVIDSAVIERSTGIPREVMKELVADMCAVLADDPLEWRRIGTFKVHGDTVVCVPNPESSVVSRLPQLDRPKHPRISRNSPDTDPTNVRATRTE